MRIAGMDPTLAPVRAPQIPVPQVPAPAVPAPASASPQGGPNTSSDNDAARAPLYERFAAALASIFNLQVRVVDPHDRTFDVALDIAAHSAEQLPGEHRPILSIRAAPHATEFEPRPLPLRSAFGAGNESPTPPEVDVSA